MNRRTTKPLATAHSPLRGLRTQIILNRQWLWLFLLGLLCSYLLADQYTRHIADTITVTPAHTRQQQAINALAMGFEKNLGQTDAEVAYIARAPGYTLYLTPAQATIRLHSAAANTALTQQRNTLHMRFIGAAENSELTGQNLLRGRINYLHGSDNRQQNIPRYQQVLAAGVYPGIDVVYYGGQDRQLEYDLRLAAGADPDRINIVYQGADSLAVDDDGNLLIHLPAGQLRQLKPTAYQMIDGERHLIDADYAIKDAHSIGINIAAYDPAYPLVIDPTLEYASFIGGAKNDLGLAIAVDDDGAIYIAGSTQSLDFPTEHALQTNKQGKSDIFVAKLTPQGDSLEYATYIGGSKPDQANAIALDDAGNVYLVGVTRSGSDFPLHNAQQADFGRGVKDAFALKLSADGSELIYSTYIGGSKKDSARAIAVDDAGNAYIAGDSRSGGSFPLKNPLPRSARGKQDIFYLKLDTTGVLQTASLIGGSKKDLATGIALDADGIIYISGYTNSSKDFPLLAANQAVYGGGKNDAFVVAINPESDQLIYASYFGGSKDDKAHDISVDIDGNMYLTGTTNSPDLPLKQAWQNQLAGARDAFIARFDNTGQLSYSSYFGGKKKDAGAAIALDTFGAATITGRTASKKTLPLRRPIQTTSGGRADAFIARFDDTGNLVFASYLGGNKNDQGEDIAVGPFGDAYLVGISKSSNNAPLMNPLQPVAGGRKEAYVARIYINSAPQIVSQPLTEAIEAIAYQYPVIAEDADSDPLTYALLTAPAGMAINPNTGAVSWQTPLPGVYPLHLRVFDDMGAYGDQNYTLTVLANNNPPQISSQPILTAMVDQAYQYAVIAVDADADPLQYQLNLAPLGMHIDPVSGLIDWQPVATGDYPVEIQVSDNKADPVLQNYTVTVSDNPDNLPPLLAALDDQTVPLGTRSSLELIASDPENQPLTFSVTPLPLPQGATLDRASGLFTFKPGPDQVGAWTFTFAVSDGRFITKQTVTMTVPAIDASAPTRFIGRVVDATARERGLDLPIVGATVSFLDTGIETTSDANGDFILSGLPQGVFVFSIDSSTANPAPGGSGYASYHIEKSYIDHVDNVVDRPFSLPRINTGAQINPTLPIVVSNQNISVSLTIPANTAKRSDGSQFTGRLSISEVPRGLTPGILPPELDPGLIITIQPLGVTFATPVPITFPNIDNLPAGAETDIMSLNPDSGRFVVVGKARVSADGQRIETFEGGVRQSDWHFSNSKPEKTRSLNDPDNPCRCPNVKGTSSFSLSDGRMSTAFSLPAYRSLEQSRALTFTYQTNRAYPHPVIPVSTGLGGFIAAPPLMSGKLKVAGLEQSTPYFYNSSSLQRPISRPNGAPQSIQMSLAFDATSYPTGMYAYDLTVTNHYQRSNFGTVAQGSILVINEQNSPFGAGWMLRGLYRLVLNTDASVLLVSPDGRPINYRPDGSGQYTSPDNDYAVLTRLADGSFNHREKNGIQMHFAADGTLTSHEDRNGNTTTYDYDDDGTLLSITDPVGLVTRFVYRHGKLASVTDPADRISRFDYDAAGNLTAVTYPDGSAISHQYDHRHLMIRHSDERNNTYVNRYDEHGKVIDGTLPDGTVRTASNQYGAALFDGFGSRDNPAPSVMLDDVNGRYIDGRGNASEQTLDPHGRPLITVDELGRTTTYLRDADSNPTQTTRPNGSVVNRTFDDFGNTLTKTEQFNGALYRYSYNNFSQVTGYTNPNNHTTTINRDAASGNPLTIVNHLGHTTTLEYDSRGLITRSLSPNGLETVHTYNAQGLLDSQTQIPPADSPGNVRVTHYSYHPTGLIKQLITPDNITLNYVYDDRSDLLSVTDNLGQSMTYHYDEHKNIIQIDTGNSDGSLALTVANVYDNRNRLIKTLAPHKDDEDSVSEYRLDNNSNLIELIDPNGNSANNRHDPFNRLTHNTHRLNGVTRYEYDLLDRITKVTAPNGVITEYQNDLIGRRTKEISRDRGTVSYQYDVANNLISMTDGRDITSTYVYDELERLTGKTYPNSVPDKDETVVYHYDDCAFGIGGLCARSDESGDYAYQYDSYGNLTHTRFTETAGVVYTMGYVYDDGDHIIQTTYPSGRVLDIARDAVRRIERIDSRADIDASPQTILDSLQYRGDNQMTRCRYGNGLSASRDYDLQGRLSHQLLKNDRNDVIDERTYHYDLNSNILSRTTTPQNSQYRYDPLDRIIQENRNGLFLTGYAYDLNDNRLRVDDQNGIDTYRYHDNSNRLDFTDRLEETGPAETVESSRELIYNDAGRLFQLLEDGELKGEYLYNDQGQRTKKIAYLTAGTTTTTIYHYDQSGRLISETQEDGSPIKDYIYVNGRPVAQIDHEGPAETIQYLYTDHLYTPRLATDRNQNVTWRWDGEAFGGDAAQELGARINLRFPGQYFDDESGLFYNWMRYYDPGTGRYISSDPIGLFGGLNTYSYALLNPTNFIDPDGLQVAVPLPVAPPVAVTGGLTSGAKAPRNFSQLAEELREITGSPTGLDILLAVNDINQIIISEALDNNCPDNSEDDGSKQDKKLTKGEIKKLKGGGIDAEELKGGKRTGKLDLFKDKRGNIVIKPKDGKGKGDPTGININDF